MTASKSELIEYTNEENYFYTSTYREERKLEYTYINFSHLKHTFLISRPGDETLLTQKCRVGLHSVAAESCAAAAVEASMNAKTQRRAEHS